MKYRKKPVEIEAFQYDGDLKTSHGFYYVPQWAVEAFESGIMYYGSTGAEPCELFIKTLEGDHHVSVGDYIIKGVQGEFYPCKPDIFKLTYEDASNAGWIPVSERLPETNQSVLITFREYMTWNKKYRYGICKAIYIPSYAIKAEDMWTGEDGGCEEYFEEDDTYYVQQGWYEVIEHWDDYTNAYINCEVIAWMPLPERYGEND